MLRDWYEEASVICEERQRDCGELSVGARDDHGSSATSNYWRRRKFVVASGSARHGTAGLSVLSPLLLTAPLLLLLLLLLQQTTSGVRSAHGSRQACPRRKTALPSTPVSRNKLTPWRFPPHATYIPTRTAAKLNLVEAFKVPIIIATTLFLLFDFYEHALMI